MNTPNGLAVEIVHLGDFWNESGIRPHKGEILKINTQIKRIFERAYRYIKAAAAIYEDMETINNLAVNKARINGIASDLADLLFAGRYAADEEGRERKLFASAITPDGYRNYLSTVLTTQKVYVINGNPGTGTERLLEKLKTEAVEKGFYVEGYYCALKPGKLEHLVIPGLDISIGTFNKYHSAGITPYGEVNLNEYLDKNTLKEYEEVLEYDRVQFDQLMNRTFTTIKGAKALHDTLESYYIPNMDFDAIQRCREAVMARILDYAAEAENEPGE